MEDSETILVGTSIQSYSCVSLAMYPTICRCHRRSSLPDICARKRKGILATDTTRLLTYVYSLRSVSYHPFGSAISISHQISSNEKRDHKSCRDMVCCRHNSFSTEVSYLIWSPNSNVTTAQLLSGLHTCSISLDSYLVYNITMPY